MKKVFHLNNKDKSDSNKNTLAQNSVVNLSEYRNATKSSDLKTLLFVDTDNQFFSQIKKIFSPKLYSIFTAKDAMEVSKIMEETKIDVLVINTELPWMDGYDLCLLLKSIPTLKNLPIALISCNKTEEDVRRGFEAGCDDFLAKPFVENEFLQAITNLI